MRYSTPPGLVGREVWVRADGEELVIVADLNSWLRFWGRAPSGWSRSPGTGLSTPGNPRIDLSHYPDHPQEPDRVTQPAQAAAEQPEEKAFLALGPGAHAWLVEAAAVGSRSGSGRR